MSVFGLEPVHGHRQVPTPFSMRCLHDVPQLCLLLPRHFFFFFSGSHPAFHFQSLAPKPGPHALTLGPGSHPHQDPALPEQGSCLSRCPTFPVCISSCLHGLLPSASAPPSSPSSPGKPSNTDRPARFPLLYTCFVSVPF